MMLEETFGSYTDFIIKKIDEYSPIKRKRDFDTRFCLKYVLKVLKCNIPWKYIQSKAHFTTIYKRFLCWKRDNVFDKIWKDCLTIYSREQFVKNKDWANILIIDSTMIKNNAGVDGTGYNHFDRNRQATKQSIICDENQVPLSCSFYPANISDVKTIIKSIEQLNGKLRLNDSKCTSIIGDKGYLIKQADQDDILNRYNVKLLAQPRQNMKKQLSKEDSSKFNNRSRIENLFCRLDKFARLRSRFDRKLDNYETFNFMAMIILTIKKLS
jgi:transposase